MKRFLAVFVGGLGFGALLRRRKLAVPAAPPSDTDSPAEELRAKLAESRATAEEPVVEETAAEEPADLAARRHDVHEQARRALDELS